MGYKDELASFLPDDEGFHLGPMYVLRTRSSVRVIPRASISYVGATFNHKPILIALSVLAIVAALISAKSPAYFIVAGIVFERGTAIAVSLVLAVVFVYLYFLTREVGISIASSGGKMFIVLRGKSRFELINRIYADLDAARVLSAGGATPE